MIKDSIISSNIYYASIGSKILMFFKTNSDKNTFVTLSNRLLKRIRNKEVSIDPQNLHRIK